MSARARHLKLVSTSSAPPQHKKEPNSVFGGDRPSTRMPAGFTPSAYLPGLTELIAHAGEKMREQELVGYWAAIDPQTIREDTRRRLAEREADESDGAA